MSTDTEKDYSTPNKAPWNPKAPRGKNEGTKVISDLINFYKTPLVRAIVILNKKYHVTYQQIADEVFDGRISKQAIAQNYRRSPK